MIRGYSCWECGHTYGATAVRGLFAVVVHGNDEECEHETLHPVISEYLR